MAKEQSTRPQTPETPRGKHPSARGGGITIEQILKTGRISEGEIKNSAGQVVARPKMVAVTVLIDGFRDNGNTYAAGDAAHMEVSVARPAIDAGQVALAEAS